MQLKKKSDRFSQLSKICVEALKKINELNDVEFTTKITLSAFCYCKSDDINILLIDDLRNKLGENYFMWEKKVFWNTWQNLENYFRIDDYSVYCLVIIHDFLNKLLRIKINKEFIKNYLVSSLEEKKNLLENNGELNEEKIKENKEEFEKSKKELINVVDSFKY